METTHKMLGHVVNYGTSMLCGPEVMEEEQVKAMATRHSIQNCPI